MKAILISCTAVAMLTLPSMAQPFCPGVSSRLLAPVGGQPVAEVLRLVVAQNECGAFVLAWYQRLEDDVHVLTASSADGVSWSEPQELALVPGWVERDTYYLLGVGIDGVGKALVVWPDLTADETRPHLRYSSSDDLGATWSAPSDLYSGMPSYATNDGSPVVLGLHEGGFVIAWQQTGFFPMYVADGSDTTHVMFTRMTAAGELQEPAFVDTPMTPTLITAEFGPSLLQIGDSTLLATFFRSALAENVQPGVPPVVNSYPWFRSMDGGVSWQPLDGELPVSLADRQSHHLEVDRSTGRLVLAWVRTDELVDDTYRKSIYISTSDDGGISWSEPLRVSGDEPGRYRFLPRLSWRSGLGWGLAWTLGVDDCPHSYAQVSFSQNGVEWREPCTVDSPHSLDDSFLACASGGEWLLFSHGIGKGITPSVSSPIVLSQWSPQPPERTCLRPGLLCGCVSGWSWTVMFLLLLALKCCVARVAVPARRW